MAELQKSGFLRRWLPVILLAVSTVLVAVEGTWGYELHHHWTFVPVVVILLFLLGMAVAGDLRTRSICSLMSHLGMFLVLSGGLSGALLRTDVQMEAFTDGGGSRTAFDRNGYVVTLPFSISLQDFRIDTYDDGTSPKQYTSTLDIDGRTMQTSVNHPCWYRGYRIYQSGYDFDGGASSVLKIVRDPLLPVVALGAILLALAALLSLKTVWNSWKMPVAAVALAAAFAVLSIARINLGTLVPALRSLWFIPHLIVYMLAYSILAMAVIAGIARLFSQKVPEALPGKLLSTASSLLLAGMLCGAAWAQQAWGDYWTWDTKECWAAVTWLLTLAGMHIPKKRAVLAFTILAFLAMQMTWYGVNYLPSSSRSLHTYNQE